MSSQTAYFCFFSPFVGVTIVTLFLNQQDSSITVAFDDIPEDGLNSPLRLEKLANEVLPSFALLHDFC